MGRTRYGLKNVHIAVWDEDTSTYGSWIAIPGAVSLTTDIEVNTSDFYADDVIYDTTNSVLKESGTIEFAALEDSIYRTLLGDVTNASGLTYTTTDPKNISVALGYEVNGNMGKMRGIRYNVKFTYPSDEANTMNENTSPDTVTLSYTAIGRDFLIGATTENVIHARTQEGTAAYTNFWNGVVTPGDAISGDSLDLDTLSIGSATLTPTFDAGVTAYTTTVTSSTSTVTATAADSDATVIIRNGTTVVTSGNSATWATGTNTVTVTVINGVATKVYTIVVTKS